MSEYQYYEFKALDRPLTHTEMAELRAVSTRAVITSTRFVNHYEWGDLKADPADWMRRYFDAFVYSANWCSCCLSLRLPKTAFCLKELQPFINGSTLFITESDEHWIFNWALDESEDYDRFGEDDGSGWMQQLLPLRDELLRGDLRPLYLGWLAGANALDDDVLEPEVPPGLANLSSAQEALAEFLEIGPDLLTAARAGSAALSADSAENQHIATWLDTWSNDDMRGVLKQIALGQSHEAERQVKSRYAVWLKARHPSHPSTPPISPRRQGTELLELAQAAATVRQEHEAKERAKQEAEHRRQRETQLRQLMVEADKHWKAAEMYIERGGASGYQEAVRTLADLAEGYALVSSRKAFDLELRQFLAPHTKRTALLRRLADAGLWTK